MSHQHHPFGILDEDCYTIESLPDQIEYLQSGTTLNRHIHFLTRTRSVQAPSYYAGVET